MDIFEQIGHWNTSLKKRYFISHKRKTVLLHIPCYYNKNVLSTTFMNLNHALLYFFFLKVTQAGLLKEGDVNRWEMYNGIFTRCVVKENKWIYWKSRTRRQGGRSLSWISDHFAFPVFWSLFKETSLWVHLVLSQIQKVWLVTFSSSWYSLLGWCEALSCFMNACMHVTM